MDEISPTLIAEIATRLFNDLPGSNIPPKSESDASHFPQANAPHLPHSPQATPTPPTNPAQFGPTAQTVSHANPQAHLPNVHTQPSLPPSGPSHSMGPLVNPGSPQHSPTELSPSSNSGHTIYETPPAHSLPSTPYPTSTNPAFTHLSHPHIGSSRESVNAPEAARHGLQSSNLSSSGVASSGSSSGIGSSGPATGQNYDGLAAFVRRIRNPHDAHDSRGGQAGIDPNQDILRRIFSQQAVPNGGSRPFDLPSIRRDFPILHQNVHGRPLAWFDNAATTQKPRSVIDAISRFYAHDNSNIHRAAHTLAARATDAYEQARQKVQGFLGAASSKEIIFVRGTTEGINLVAKSYGGKFFQPGDEIVLSNLEHHANIVPWQMVAKHTGAVLRVVPVNDRGEIMLEEYQRLLGPRTKFVSLTYASNSLGTILPVAEMTQLAKRYNARVLIDGAQSVAHIPTNVNELGCDFFVFSGHKIFGPTGIGAVFAKQEVQEIMPPWQGGGAMIKNVTFEESSYNDPPTKFEAGTPNIADAVGLGAALDYVTRLGLPNIGRYEHELLEHGTERLSHINGIRLLGTARNKVSVLSFVLNNHRTEEVGKYLDQEGIAVRAGHHCAQPSLRRFGVETTVRPSFAFYNTKEEIDRMYEALKRLTRS
jgi:cysteine desulfurase/selenocysteine lyase